MPTGIKITITDLNLIESYNNILSGKNSKGVATDRSTLTSLTEGLFSQTLFKGAKIAETPHGVSSGDWFVTDSSMVSLVKAMSSTEILNTKEFTQWVRQSYEEESVTIEGKLLQNNEKDSDIKIGGFTITGDDHSVDSFNLSTNTQMSNVPNTPQISGLIDVTKHSIINELRQAWSIEDQRFADKGINFSSSTSGLPELNSKALNKAKLSDFNKKLGNISRDMQAFLNTDQTFIKLRSLMEKLFNGSSLSDKDKESLPMYVNTINNRYVRAGFLRELNLIGKDKDKDTLFKYILKVPDLAEQFYQKSRNIVIMRKLNNGDPINAVLLTFPREEFTSKFFTANFDVSTGKINIAIKSSVEKQFNEELSTKAAQLIYDGNKENFQKSVNELISTKKLTTSSNGITYFEMNIPTGGSIPMSSASINLSDKLNIIDSSDFVAVSNRISQQAANQPQYNMGTFLSSEYLRLLIVKKVIQEMPKGPIGGRETDPDILTYRTGRFATSIDIAVNYRKQLIEYYYNPIYYVHQKTARDPRELITKSIEEVMREHFKQNFKISQVGMF